MDAPEPIEAEDTQPEVPEAPPVEDTPEPQHDYEKRYRDLRSEFDRRNEELKVLEQLRSDDPAVYSHALKELGFGGDEPEDEPATFDDPLDEIKAELAALKKERDDERAAIETEIRRQQELEHVQRQLAEVDPDKSLTQEEVNLLVAAAAQQRGEDGLPNVKAVYDLYEKGLETAVERWRNSKKAPHVPKGGQAANPANPNLDDEAERHAWITSQITPRNV
jgi:hypothetical protein